LGQLGIEEYGSGIHAIPKKLKFPEPEHVVCIMAGNLHSMAITRKGRFYTWGASSCPGRPGTGKAIRAIPGFKAMLPNMQEKWERARWIFLGRSEENSSFFRIPDEIIFHVVSTFDSDCWFFPPSLNKQHNNVSISSDVQIQNSE
jgi:hypothetical protein